MTHTITPVMLAGGAGTRLWPLSRKSFPKQFCKIFDNTTLFQASARRLTTSNKVAFSSHITLAHSDFRFIIEEQLQEVGIHPGPILIEPESKNTASAILAASVFVAAKDENSVLLVAPSDHVIPEIDDFHKAIETGLPHTDNGMIVTFGIKPSHPEIGYGYIELSEAALDDAGSAHIKQFIEKPDFNRAVQLFSAGNFLWNAGIFLFRARDMISAFELHAPEMLTQVSEAVSDAVQDLGFLRLAAEPWSRVENVSVDYAIMEKAQNLVAVPYFSKWSDLGGWDAVWAEGKPDISGNVLSKTAHALDCENSLLRSEIGSQQIVGIGLKNIIAVAMPDAVLVAQKEHAQDVKKAVEILQVKEIPEATVSARDHRPWGWFDSLVLGDRFQVKQICVKPGAALSLQSHKQRSEHWIVVEGTAKVTIDDHIQLLEEGQSVYVPLGVKHRLENTGKSFMTLIEVQIGAYLGEDDIIRYEDIYSRPETHKI